MKNIRFKQTVNFLFEFGVPFEFCGLYMIFVCNLSSGY